MSSGQWSLEWSVDEFNILFSSFLLNHPHFPPPFRMLSLFSVAGFADIAICKCLCLPNCRLVWIALSHVISCVHRTVYLHENGNSWTNITKYDNRTNSQILKLWYYLQRVTEWKRDRNQETPKEIYLLYCLKVSVHVTNYRISRN